MNERGTERETFRIYPIGYIRRTDEEVQLKVLEPYRPALKQLEHFSHVIAIWWAHKHDNKKSRNWLQTEPPYAKGKTTGIFATRAEYRPNPIALSTCRILSVDDENGIIRVKDIDAYDGTPLLDLKAYFLVLDRVKEAHIPDWLEGWPEWLPDEGIGLEE